MSESGNINRGDQLCTIGLDVGGTKMAACVTTQDGKVHLHDKRPTLASRGGQAVADDALQMLQNLSVKATEQGLQPEALGIGICELVDVDGNIASEHTIAWRDPTYLNQFSDLLPTAIEADARAAALAEARFGAGKEFPIFLYVTVGTGIGSSLVIDGKPFAGARGATGTMATGDLSTLCSECGAISQSNLEQIASGTAIGQRYAPSARHERSAITAEGVFAAANAGEETARQVLKTGACCLGSMIAQLVNMLDPHAVIVGGGLGAAPGYYWETLVDTARQQIWSELNQSLPIVQSDLGELATATGAAVFAAERYKVYY